MSIIKYETESDSAVLSTTDARVLSNESVMCILILITGCFSNHHKYTDWNHNVLYIYIYIYIYIWICTYGPPISPDYLSWFTPLKKKIINFWVSWPSQMWNRWSWLYFSRVGLISSLINLVERPPLWQVGPAILLPHHGLKKSHFNTLDFPFQPDNYTIIRLHTKKNSIQG